MMSAAALVAGEAYSTWGYHKFIAVNTRRLASGSQDGGIYSDQYKFPVLVRLDSANFAASFGQSFGRGADLRFTKLGDSVRLAHEIERWDSAGKKAEIWVKVDTIKAQSVNIFRMHWGKLGAADSSQGSVVFDTAEGFQAVWHLNESASDSIRDATANRFHGAPSGNPASDAGQIGRGRSFNGTSQYFEIPNSASGRLAFPVDGVYALSAWAFIDSAAKGQDRFILAKSGNEYALKIGKTNFNLWQFLPYDSILAREYPYGNGGVGRWTYVVGTMAGVVSGSNSFIYVDGNESRLRFLPGAVDRTETGNLFVARTGAAAPRSWLGRLDEIRIASVYRPADWVYLEYQIQARLPGKVIYADTFPVVSVRDRPETAKPQGSLRFVPGGLEFRIPTGEHRAARFSVSDLRGRLLWSRTVMAASGFAQAFWSDGAYRRAGASTGIHVATMVVLDAQGAAVLTDVRKLTLTP
jgi:hypothetical protein